MASEFSLCDQINLDLRDPTSALPTDLLVTAFSGLCLIASTRSTVRWLRVATKQNFTDARHRTINYL